MHIHTHLVFHSLQGLGPVPSSGLLKCYLIIQVFCFFSNGKDVTNLEITSSIQFILISFCLFISVKCPYEKLNLFFSYTFLFSNNDRKKISVNTGSSNGTSWGAIDYCPRNRSACWESTVEGEGRRERRHEHNNNVQQYYKC